MSYQNAADNLETVTGMKVSRSTPQRLVHRQEFTALVACDEVEELSVDGGKVRIRTPVGEASMWRDYKAVNLHSHGVAAFFQDNPALVDWVNSQQLAPIVTCLGDGHGGIWNIMADIATASARHEILDWYHLIENLLLCGWVTQPFSKGGSAFVAR